MATFFLYEIFFYLEQWQVLIELISDYLTIEYENA